MIMFDNIICNYVFVWFKKCYCEKFICILIEKLDVVYGFESICLNEERKLNCIYNLFNK